MPQALAVYLKRKRVPGTEDFVKSVCDHKNCNRIMQWCIEANMVDLAHIVFEHAEKSEMKVEQKVVDLKTEFMPQWGDDNLNDQEETK